MATQGVTFAGWLQDSAVAEDTLTAAQQAVLQSAWHFLNHRGRDYFSGSRSRGMICYVL
jgi:hypothetical protein